LNETYYVGNKSKANPDAVRVVETARNCLTEGINIAKPGTPLREFGNVIEKYATEQKCGLVRTYCGHGINTMFHCEPTIPHYAKSKTVGTAKPGMCFTLEPMVTLGSHKDEMWPDGWTSVTIDGKLTAQFGKYSPNPSILNFIYPVD
jgi:methionyl aminopeptidase